MRAARERSGIPKAAIVGYTNAGKSTLLNALTDAGVLSEDKLFATLDPTTRRLSLPDGQEILLTDTVGFIRHLPHQLIRAFHSTLEEAALADILLIVCDVSDPECAEQLNVTQALLEELGAGDIPQLLVYNKCDLAESYDPETYNTDPSHRVFLSAKDGRGLDDLLAAISCLLHEGKREMTLEIPYDRAGLLNRLRGECHFLEEPAYLDTGITVKVMLDSKNYGKFPSLLQGRTENDRISHCERLWPCGNRRKALDLHWERRFCDHRGGGDPLR
jgi:GTP-binding protein HflX